MAISSIFITLAAPPAGAQSNPADESVVVWQIGKEDQDYAEFAIAGKYGDYQKQFPQQTIFFQIGKSDPSTDWPYIQPGTLDGWAGGRSHPRSIRFSLADEPRGEFLLRIALVDVHPSVPPVLTVTINSHEGNFPLEAGGGDASLTSARSGKPQIVEIPISASLLTKGLNELTLSSEEGGSWLIYDAVTLLNSEKALNITRLSAKPTPLFVEHDGVLGRVVEVELTLSRNDPPPTLRATIDGSGAREIPLGNLPLFGSARTELLITDSDKPHSVSIIASMGTETRTTTIRVDPVRKWTIYIAPASHNDIGFSDPQAATIEGHNQDTATALGLADRYPDYRWDLECSFQAETFLAMCTGQQREDFLRLAREGHIGVSASYANMLTGLLSTEGACQLFQYAAELHRKHGIASEWAMVSDVPTMEASYPMFAANSGVRYITHGINNTRAPTYQPYAESPYWWEGPDGSRVLVAACVGYGQARAWGVCESVSATKAQVENKLAGFEKRADYPYDAVFVHGEEGDNTRLNPKMAEVVKEWNERYAYPRIVLSAGPEFFKHIEQNYGAKLPVIKGSEGAYWEDGAGSTAHETALDRGSQANLGSAETFLALAQRIRPGNYPLPEIESAWRNCLLYDEHTWGADESVRDPQSSRTVAQWKYKAQFALEADKQSSDLLEQGQQALAARIRTTEQSLVVLNPSGWNRSDIILVNLPEGLVISEPGVSTCTTESGVYAWVKDVPACGYRTLKLAAAHSQPAAQIAEGNTLESRDFRISFDPASGGISSIIDKETNRELVNPGAPYKLNQYLYVAGGKGTRIESPDEQDAANLAIGTSQNVTFKKMRLGALGEMMVIESSATMTPRISTTVLAWNDVKRIDIENRLTKKLTYDKEAGYFAFPFTAQSPTFRYEIPLGIVNANTEMLPGACLDWFSVQDFVEVEGKDGAVVWATPDAPMACFQDINRGLWRTKLPMMNGHIYGYVLNNYWFGNYRAGQGGDFLFRFVITSRKASDPAASARFGAGVSNPLRALIAGPNPGGVLKTPAGGLLDVAEPNAQLVGIHLAHDGRGTIVRLWETAGKDTTVHLDAKALHVQKASACNLVEEGANPLPLKSGVVTIALTAHGVATVRLE